MCRPDVMSGERELTPFRGQLEFAIWTWDHGPSCVVAEADPVRYDRAVGDFPLDNTI